MLVVFLGMLPSFLCAKVLTIVAYGDSTDLIVHIDSLDFVNLDGGVYPSIGTPNIYEAGAPELPSLQHTFLFGEARTLVCKVMASKTQDTSLYISPSQGLVSWDEREQPRVEGPFYQKNAFYPDHIFTLGASFRYREKFGQKLQIFPMQYHPLLQQLHIYHDLHIRVYHPKIKHKSATIETVEVSRKSILIVAPDSLSDALEPLVNWKRQIGLHVYHDNVEGIDNLKLTIQDYYDQVNLDYVLLVGGASQVPTLNSTYGPGDNNYGFVAGSDPYMDVYVGRLPVADRKELSYYIQKLIKYERGAVDQRVLRCLGIASVEETIGDDDETDFQHISSITSRLKGCSFDSLLMSPILLDNESVSLAINAGQGLMCYAGHGDQIGLRTFDYTIDSLMHLRNDVYPFFIDVACLNGAFTSGSCFASRFVNAQKDRVPVGGIGIIASTISQPWKPPMRGQDVMVDKIIEAYHNDTVYCLGEIVSDGFFEMINAYGDGGIETALTWNLFADPSLPFWSGLPKPLSLQTDSVFYMNEDSLIVYSDEGAIVSLFANHQVCDLATVVGGKAVLRPGIVQAADSVLITAYKKGYAVAQRRMALANKGGAFYGLDSLCITEDNGVVESGELVQIYPVIKNYGDTIGKGLTIELLECSPFLFVADSCIDLNGVESHSVSQTAQPFFVEIDENLPDMQEANLLFRVTDSLGQSNSFASHFYVKSPLVKHVKTLCNDVSLDAKVFVVNSDSLELQLVYQNQGHASQCELKSTLVCASPYLNTVDAVLEKHVILPLSTDTFTYVLQVNPAIPRGTTFTVTLSLGDRVWSYPFIAKGDVAVQLGELDVAVSEYPFYNYYKNNKTQFLLTAEELAALDNIDSLGFYISSYPNVSSFRQFNNLQICVGETQNDALGFSFTEGLTEVFSSPLFTLPLNEGWAYFDLADIEIVKDKNYIVEMLWGPNPYCTSYNNSFEVMGHRCANNVVVYGYHDTQSPPLVRNVSHYRPTVALKPRAVQGIDFKVKVQRQDASAVLHYSLIVGSELYHSDALGEVELTLFAGDYPIVVLNAGDSLLCGVMCVDESTHQVLLTLEGSIPVMTDHHTTAFVLRMNSEGLQIDAESQTSGELMVYDLKGILLYQGQHFFGHTYIAYPFTPGRVYLVKIGISYYKVLCV